MFYVEQDMSKESTKAGIYQLPLPFPEWRRIRLRHVEWLRLANSLHVQGGDYQHWKHWLFYPFKDEFLTRHAVPDGWDIQILTLPCRSCYQGVFVSECGNYQASCWRCDGTGIYRIDAVKLQRFIFRVQGSEFRVQMSQTLFHRPVEYWRGSTDCADRDCEEQFANIKAGGREIIYGKILHKAISEREARRAFYRLLIRFDRRRLWMLLRLDARALRLRVEYKIDHALWPIRALYQDFFCWLQTCDDELPTNLREYLGMVEEESVPF